MEATMKKTLLITGVLLALTAGAASAAGVNLNWTDCIPNAGLQTNKAFACNSNNGTNTMVATFDPPPSVTELNGNNLIIDIQSASNPLPQWWRFKNAGTCRLASLGANAVFPNTGPAICVDQWALPSPGVSAYIENAGGNPSRARLGGSISVATGGPVDPGTEYYSLVITVNNQKTVGTGACAGCSDPVCIVLNEIKLTQPAGTPGGSPVLTNPVQQNFVTWQGGAVGGAGCPGATPAINKTWGQVKAIYR
jgi:hypothetical protein